MIRVLLSGLLLLCAAWLPGQLNRPDHYNALSARVLAVDHNLPNETFDGLSTTFALELGYRRQLGKILALKVPLKIGVIDVGELENPTIVGIDLLAQIYPLGTNGGVSPFLHGGYGVVSEGFEAGNAQIPLGAGFNFNLGGNSWFNVQGEYRMSNQELRDNVMVGLGYVYRLTKLDTDGDGILNRDDLCPDMPGPAGAQGCPDTDQDGITDADDQCPTQAGPASLNGCPDTDGDGLTDAEDACPEAAGPALTKGCPDRDGDGVPDAGDACPDKPGPANFSGCPDTDGDGTADHLDECRSTPGPADHAGCPDTDGDGKYDNVDNCPEQAASTPDGCPVPDRDGDGVPDEVDACPGQAGPVGGCPDTDGDGIADQNDPCPTQAGAPNGDGCPEIEQEVQERLEYAARAVEFESGSARLKEKSYVILSEIALIMGRYPDYNLVISGHTDDRGEQLTNLNLSRRRALACEEFLLATGIRPRRISSAGFGESQPKASNDTAEGRRMNRRVEFALVPGN
ncbi:OmpA family protein [Lewinella sp. W8]|uniref:OmpA family protein n=1 Tax=Lewinella sp. W8 TaxID=2528208 RepID=UPI001067A717|nr:thrombospondin type 3 repeat-containing protein [Lewinella sp. W8]MTB49672.1 OmpA family protein [Lewinella sp. W8]